MPNIIQYPATMEEQIDDMTAQELSYSAIHSYCTIEDQVAESELNASIILGILKPIIIISTIINVDIINDFLFTISFIVNAITVFKSLIFVLPFININFKI